MAAARICSFWGKSTRHFSPLLREARFVGQRFVDVRHVVAADTPVAAVSRLPECLDFVATCAVFAFGYGLAWQTGLIAYLVSTLSSPPN